MFQSSAVTHMNRYVLMASVFVCVLQVTVSESVALLHVSYQSADGGRVTQRVQLSSLLEQ